MMAISRSSLLLWNIFIILGVCKDALAHCEQNGAGTAASNHESCSPLVPWCDTTHGVNKAECTCAATNSNGAAQKFCSATDGNVNICGILQTASTERVCACGGTGVAGTGTYSREACDLNSDTPSCLKPDGTFEAGVGGTDSTCQKCRKIGGLVGDGTTQGTCPLGRKCLASGKCSGGSAATPAPTPASTPAPTAVDCAWSTWSKWSDCGVTCGTATQIRSRIILNHESNGGMYCTGDPVEARACAKVVCPSSPATQPPATQAPATTPPSSCRDISRNCGRYANRITCSSNPYVRQKCQRSCHRC